jgi:ferritin
MLNNTVQDALNQHMNQEFYSSYLYLAMSAYCESINLSGFAHWLRVQSQEEMDHALKLFDYVNLRQGRVLLQPISQPPVEFQSPQDVMQQTLDHEQQVTAMINRLYELAVREEDYATQIHLHWFITEQAEEEKAAIDVVEQLRLIGDQGDALLLLDQRLAERKAGS